MDENTVGYKANQKYKDTLFSLIFNENPKAAVEVSNSFLGTRFPADTKVVFKTLRRVLTTGRVNDLAFLLEDRLIVLIEHQSTLCENMAYRMLQYITETYKKLNSRKSEYRDKQIRLKRPKFIVLYNGARPMKDDFQIFRLSDMFPPATPEDGPDDGLIDLELTVKMYNITNGRNKDMVSRCATLQEYSIFISMIHEYRQKMSLEEAIQKAVVDCIDKNVLKEFLLKHKKEVVNMLASEWDIDTALAVKLEEGQEIAQEKIARNMKREGELSIEKIASLTGLTVDDVLRLEV